jgi:hypothetical protein
MSVVVDDKDVLENKKAVLGWVPSRKVGGSAPHIRQAADRGDAVKEMRESGIQREKVPNQSLGATKFEGRPATAILNLKSLSLHCRQPLNSRC